MMSDAMHPAAPHHMPFFITAPGQSDVLFNVMVVFLVVMILLVGVFYFKLHALPERIAHKGQKIQFELVAVLALISLFTHNHVFWIAGLLLAFIPIPDFTTPLTGMAESLARMASRGKRVETVDGSAASIPAQAEGSVPPAVAANISPVPETLIAAPRSQVAGEAEHSRRALPAELATRRADAPDSQIHSSSEADPDRRPHAVSKERA